MSDQFIGGISQNLTGESLTTQLFPVYLFTPCCGGPAIRLKPSEVPLDPGTYNFDEGYLYDGVETGLLSNFCYTLSYIYITDETLYNNLPVTPSLVPNSFPPISYWSEPFGEGCEAVKCPSCENYPTLVTFQFTSCCDENDVAVYHLWQYEDAPITNGVYHYTGTTIPQGCYTIVDLGVYQENVYNFLTVADLEAQGSCDTPVCNSYCPQPACYDFTNCQTGDTFIGTLSNESEFTGDGTYSLSFTSGSTITVQGLQLGLGFSLDSDDPLGASYTVTALPLNETYNSKPVYEAEVLGNTYYVLWNEDLARWEFWESYSYQTGPQCNNCCGVNVPWLFIDAVDPITTLGPWGTVNNGCDNFNPVKGIRVSEYVDVNIPLSTTTDCWTVEERTSCTDDICAYVFYQYQRTGFEPIEFNTPLVTTEFTYNGQPVYYIQNDAFPIPLYLVYTGAVWQAWSGFDEITGPFCDPITLFACCEDSPGVFLPYFESVNLLNNTWTNLCVPLPDAGGNPIESTFILETYNCGAVQEPLEVTIVEKFESCADCFGNCYKATDCLTGEVIYYQGVYLSAYIGKIIKVNRVFPDGYTRVSCFTIEEGVCQPGAVEFPFEVLDCFTECEDCLPKCICSSVVNSGTVSKRLAYTDCEGNRTFTAEFVPAGKRSKKYCVLSWDDVDAFDELQFGNCEDGQCPVTPQPKKFVAPGYDTPVCTPEQYEKILCNYSEQAYKQVLADRYGISNCCPEDEIKWEIKYELIKLEALIDPDYTCQNLSDCGCGYISSDIHTYTCPTPEPEPEPEPEPNPLPCNECILATFVPFSSTTPVQVYIPPTDVYANGTYYYNFSYEGTNYEIYNETWNTIGADPGGWYLYAAGGGGDIGYNSTAGTCPAGTFVMSEPEYFDSFAVSICGAEVTDYVLYSVFIDGGGADSSFTYPDCEGNAQTKNFPGARGGYTVFVCSTPGQSAQFIASSAITFTVTETTANCNC